MVKLPPNKTKIVCTIGPASESQTIMEQMIRAGMNVARLNLSHGDFENHAKIVQRLRNAAKNVGRRVAIMADLPGPKMRVGEIKNEPIMLQVNDTFILTTEEIVGDASRAFVTFPMLPKVVKAGDVLYLNDGIIRLKVISCDDTDVTCRVEAGGELRSRKGLNLPGIDLGISAFTPRDRECLKLACDLGLDAVSQSFVDSAADIQAVRQACSDLGYNPFVIAKIERLTALNAIDEILTVSDGIMIARGDLGVEVPIEKIPSIQKMLMFKANMRGKPVITATQMLESMTTNCRPTRAEATDVANAILDGTDCVMLSGESAVGQYPVEAVQMLASIAANVEETRPASMVRDSIMNAACESSPNVCDIIAMSVESTLRCSRPSVVFVPTHRGVTARSITRFRLPIWIVAVSSQEETCQRLQFSYGVYAVYEPDHPERWNDYIKQWLDEHGIEGTMAIVTEGPSRKYPQVNNRMEIINLERSQPVGMP